MDGGLQHCIEALTKPSQRKRNARKQNGNLYAGQEATVRTGHGTTDWFQIGKGVHKAVYCHPAYLTYTQSTS